MPGMDATTLIAYLEIDGPLLAQAAERAGWGAPVPGTEWDVRTLVTHVGGVQRWAADAIRTSAASPATEAGNAVGTGPGDAELLDWFNAGHADVVAALHAAPDDLETFAFLPADSPKHFWARRQAHEAAIHRVDAQAAAGMAITTFRAGFAQDGIAELLLGFGRRRSNAIERPASLALIANDGPSWDIHFGGERIEAHSACGFGESDAVVAGTSCELYRWLWNRPSGAQVSGDESVAELWGSSVRVSWN